MEDFPRYSGSPHTQQQAAERIPFSVMPLAFALPGGEEGWHRFKGGGGGARIR